MVGVAEDLYKAMGVDHMLDSERTNRRIQEGVIAQVELSKSQGDHDIENMMKMMTCRVKQTP
jgi:hypothetical protein